ncbi:Cytosolic phospholipase A2 gamma [Labeo rohita]|uniref:Cytosolic phospholipase A2 gamma n=1 Tax=Labeo rohita TaxID=84645 RepID=A0ABQ8L7Q5_LABRO|nr:Cytosolic phospholipase A2 gamma [Labeo rohita]
MDGSSSSPRGSEVRIGHSLNKDEEAFVARRRKTVLHCLQRLQIYRHWDDEANFVGGGRRAMVSLLKSLVQLDKAGLVAYLPLTPGVPNIALLGSGGGQRAMVGLLGSLVELDKAGLLDCILYLSGVSGSTWCMASLYQEPDWSTKLDTVKDKIIKRLNGPVVSFTEAFKKLKKYHKKNFFSLTDVWAVLAVTEYVKEINEHTLTEEWNHLSKDPFPIYTLIDKQCKQQGDGDPWFEISPYEAGYSLTGAFVDTCNFGSQFDNGSKKNHQDEFDMLYLQGGKWLGTNHEVGPVHRPHKVPTHNSSAVDKHCQVLTDLANMNLCVLNGDDPSDLDQSIRTRLKGELFLKPATIHIEGTI